MISPDAKYGFNDMAYGRLKAGIGSSATSFELLKGYVYPFLPGWASAKDLLTTFRGPDGSIEIIKITDISANRLTVARGQDGTIAQNWPAGALLTQRATGEGLGKIMQKGEFRTVSYNPDQILVANYPGEKVYQDGAEACQKRWFINRANGGVDRWGPLAGDLCGWEYLDPDGYIQFGPWLDRTDDRYWSCFANCIGWNGTYWGQAGPGLCLTTVNRAMYWVGYRPTYMAMDYEDVSTISLSVYTGVSPYVIEGGVAGKADYAPLELLPLDWTGLFEDIIRIDTGGWDLKIKEIKFIGAY